MDLRPYDSTGDIFDSLFDGENRHPWADNEVFNVDYFIRWTHNYMIDLLRHYPSDVGAIAYTYSRDRHWWSELCYFNHYLFEYQGADIEDYIPRQ